MVAALVNDSGDVEVITGMMDTGVVRTGTGVPVDGTAVDILARTLEGRGGGMLV